MTFSLDALDRRRFLRGTGVALALPWLECTAREALASDGNHPAKRNRLACFYMPDGVPMLLNVAANTTVLPFVL